MENTISTPVPPQPVAQPVIPPAAAPIRHSKKKPLIFILLAIAVVILVILGVYGYSVIHERQIENQAIALGISAQGDYNKGDYKSAESKLTQAINLTNKIPSLYASLMSVIGQEGNATGQESQASNKAQPFVKAALQLYPQNSQILTSVGYLNEIDGKYQDALSYYENALRIDPNNSEIWFHKGHDLEFLGNQNDAITAYDKAYVLDPKNPQALMGKARESIYKNKLMDAATYYDKVANDITAPNFQRSEAFLDEAIIKQSQLIYFDQTLSLAQKATSLDPSYSPALAYYGYLLSLQEKYKTATSYIDHAIKANPRIAQNYYYMGLALRNGKYYPSAISYFKYGYSIINSDNTLITQSQKNQLKANIAYELARALSLNGGSPDTLGYIKTALSLNPQLKTALNIDFTRLHYFSELSNNSDFQTLLKS